MTTALATPGTGSALWYLSRATGVVSLGLLTLVVLLGVLTVGGVPLPGLPRFAVSGLHRNASLLALVFLGIHITTSVLDPYASIKLVDAVVPFVSTYRPLWLGLGAIAFDLLLAVIVTSFLRLRIGRRWFRAVHLATYLAWPVALVHGLGTGSDTKQGWMLLFTVLAVVVVVAAVLWRLVGVPARSRRWRVAGGMVAVVAPAALAGWMALGPLAPHWAARAGTPVTLRASAVASSAVSSASTPAGTSPRAPTGQAGVSGTVAETGGAGGQLTVTLSGQLSGGPGGHLRIVLNGAPASGGGVALQSGSVSLRPAAGGSYDGPVTGLNAGTIAASLNGPAGSYSLTANIQLDQTTSGFAGTVTVT